MNASPDTQTAPLLDTLWRSLSERRRPEDIAETVMAFLRDRLSVGEKAILQQAAKGSLKQNAWAYSSMAQAFLQPVPMNRQVNKAAELFADVPALPASECAEPDKVAAFIQAISPQIHKVYGAGSFKNDRLNREARADLGLELSRRQYNKRFRVLSRMESRLSRLIQETQKYELLLVSKSALASRITYADFAADENAACFAAYYTARANLRSEFTISGQQKAFDQIAEMLLARCRAAPNTTNWWAIAHVYPTAEVLAHLSDAQKGELLGTWFKLMQTIAPRLKVIFDAGLNTKTLVVRKGNDSSTWNALAGAWQKARTGWISLLFALGMEDALQALCPGKVLPLIAADVAYWHKMAGHPPSPDLLVWNDLPAPWDVLEGRAFCTRAEVEAACKKRGLDPEKSGWTGGRPAGNAAAFRPTPELVHGVTVSSPFLADALRKAGVFSAKGVKPDALTNVPPLSRRVENGRVIVD